LRQSKLPAPGVGELTALLPSWRRRQLALGRLTPIMYELIMSQTVAQAAQLTVTESVQQS
jgi:hypothetical protein